MTVLAVDLLAGNPLLTAVRMWDQGDMLVVPRCMMQEGDPAGEQAKAKGQLAGSIVDNLGELAGRICYDSLGTGRPSGDFHGNIRKVNHLSIYEHCALTLNFHTRRHEDVAEFACAFLNQPTVFVRQVSPYDLRVTLNLRHIMEWGKARPGIFMDKEFYEAIGTTLRALAVAEAPLIMPVGPALSDVGTRDGKMEAYVPGTHATARVVPAGVPQEQWITFLVTGSRGFSHELVRHGDWTAISQRSTRYVDENESPWVEHPLETAWRKEMVPGSKPGDGMDNDPFVKAAKERYVQAKSTLEGWLISRGVEKTTARKQARGAARGYLGNALLTEVIFSANVAQWQHMMGMRANVAADAEIREVFCKALPALQGSQYGEHFKHLSLAPSPDGIGQIVVGG